MFFDDILIYSCTESNNSKHQSTVFELLYAHQLFVKASKYAFGQQSFQYLGHVITKQGVAVDQAKV